MDRTAYLQSFYNLSTADLDVFNKKLRPRTYKKGELITREGQVQKDVLFVKTGVQMSYVESDHKTHVIAFTYPPNVCAIPESFFFQVPSTYNLVCLTDSEFDVISFKELEELFNQSQPIERLFRKITEAVLAGMINRHIELHALSAEERYLAFCQRSPHLLQLVPHKYIASYLSIDATNFSKFFNKVKF